MTCMITIPCVGSFVCITFFSRKATLLTKGEVLGSKPGSAEKASKEATGGHHGCIAAIEMAHKSGGPVSLCGTASRHSTT